MVRKSILSSSDSTANFYQNMNTSISEVDQYLEGMFKAFDDYEIGTPWPCWHSSSTAEQPAAKPSE